MVYTPRNIHKLTTNHSPLQQSLFSERILHIELAYEPIFATLSPANLVRLSSTCRTAYAAVSAYTRLAFDIDRHLSRFFPSPTRGCSPTCCCFLAHPHQHAHARARARAFRSLQARTGTLVSGSMALQFFMRAVWEESDLDLYVHMRHRREVALWLLDEGYRYKPTDFQDPSFEVEIAQCVERNPNGIYSMPGLMAIVTFVKPIPGERTGPPALAEDGEEAEEDAPRELKVQIMVAKNTPMEVILGFHSTCVMNVISYEKAYCLFPQATLEERRTLLSSSCRGKGKHRMEGLAKYQARGFDILYDLPHNEVLPDPATPLYPAPQRSRYPRDTDTDTTGSPLYPPPPEPSVFDLARRASPSGSGAGSGNTQQQQQRRRTKPAFPLGWRWIDDASSYVIPLPLTGVAAPPPPPPPPANSATATAPLTHDPVAVCNWEVRYHYRDHHHHQHQHPGQRQRERGLVMHFEVATGKILRYRYLVTDELLLGHLVKEMGARVRVEEEKARLELEEWTYYDEELPTICREFLHGLAERRLSSLRI
ncbi:hypothetical protein L227DRAFT_491594 [Lentinus tigrinus ALCF2SS1-6]|uniref:Uncharacterized protein n=1 Tax=Lentinus tigrinus ALCF2SS1-6 TaxID=1328759 RepID=A0A5C2SU45_9APHY|nr:hypothetical protein L227DRAFT_491594 [Lentinus tigrinus ALCF2SS1-6]